MKPNDKTLVQRLEQILSKPPINGSAANISALFVGLVLLIAWLLNKLYHFITWLLIQL
jgi:hypothetical protein